MYKTKIYHYKHYDTAYFVLIWISILQNQLNCGKICFEFLIFYTSGIIVFYYLFSLSVTKNNFPTFYEHLCFNKRFLCFNKQTSVTAGAKLSSERAKCL